MGTLFTIVVVAAILFIGYKTVSKKKSTPSSGRGFGGGVGEPGGTGDNSVNDNTKFQI